jgi:hypothetical protein
MLVLFLDLLTIISKIILLFTFLDTNYPLFGQQIKISKPTWTIYEISKQNRNSINDARGC